MVSAGHFSAPNVVYQAIDANNILLIRQARGWEGYCKGLGKFDLTERHRRIGSTGRCRCNVNLP
jgi:hypothetical protein